MTPQTQETSRPIAAAPGRYAVLHVGCGPASPEKLHACFREPCWREIRVDIDPAVAPDIVASVTDLSMIPTASVHAVWSSHNLEHLFAHEVPRALAEFHRVLRPEGFALITLPDLQKVAELVLRDHMEDTVMTASIGVITTRDIIYGHGPSIAAGQHFMAHKTGFTARTLGEALLEAGFGHVDINRTGYDLWALAENQPR